MDLMISLHGWAGGGGGEGGGYLGIGEPLRSSTAFCGRILSALRKKDGESGTKTQNRQGFVCC